MNADKNLKHLEIVIILSRSESNRLVIFEIKNIIYNLMNKKRLETKQARLNRLPNIASILLNTMEYTGNTLIFISTN